MEMRLLIDELKGTYEKPPKPLAKNKFLPVRNHSSMQHTPMNRMPGSRLSMESFPLIGGTTPMLKTPVNEHSAN